MSDQSPMLVQYERIKASYPSAFVFFRLGDFYEMFKDDALEASRLLGLTLTKRQDMPMCGVPYHASKPYIAKLLSAGKSIALCEQVSDAKSSKGLVDRRVVQVYTAGTVLEDDFLSQSTHNFILSLGPLSDHARLQEWSYAVCDPSTGELFISSIKDIAQKSILELLETWQAREILLPESFFHEHPDLAQLFIDRECPVHRFGEWIYDAEDAHQKLCEQLKVTTLKGFGLSASDSELLKPCAALIRHLEATLFTYQGLLRSIKVIKDNSYVNLDETSIRNLELIKNMYDGSEAHTLFSIMNFTSSSAGARLLKYDILHPLRSIPELQRRLDIVAFFREHRDLLHHIQKKLSSSADLQRISARILVEKAHPKEMLSYALSIENFCEILTALTAEEFFWLISNHDFSDTKSFALRIRNTLDDEPNIDLNEGGIVREGFDAEIDELRVLEQGGQELLDSYLAEEIRLSGISNLKIKYNRIIGYFFEVTKSQSPNVPTHFIRKQSLVTGERFTSPRLRELEEKILGARDVRIEREKKVFSMLRSDAKNLLPKVHLLSEIIARLDVLCGFASLSLRYSYCRPSFSEEAILEIKEGRHPVVEGALGPGMFIPNDALLLPLNAGPFLALVTGPNMAGKSTYLRQNALITLIAHMGAYVPASSAHIGIVDRIYCRVGASDNLTRGESTFLVEMNETAYILGTASQNSLIIMDEVGRGTGTLDGLSIAQAILEDLLNRIQCRCFFATHFHELTEIQNPGLKNLSLKVHEDGSSITFLRRVQEGPSGNSYGIHVAELAGLPAKVIERSTALLSEFLRTRQGWGENQALAPQKTVKRAMVQPDLFYEDVRDTIYDLIKNKDPNRMTPLEALTLLTELKQKILD